MSDYDRFSLGGTYDGDLEMSCAECGHYIDGWTWQEPHTLTDYLRSADEHNATVHPPTQEEK